MYGYIYETTNLINGKKYIGMHKSESFDDRYKGSGVLLSKAIRKYGINNFTCSVLKECATKDELYHSEIEFISRFDAVNSDDYYNIANGGQGGDTMCNLDEDFKRRRLEYLSPRGRIWITDGVVEKMVFPNQLPDYTSQGFRKGKIPFTEEHKKKIGRPGINRGRRWEKSQESKDKVRGKNNPMYGSKYRWVNDGTRNYRWGIDDEVPHGYSPGKIRR